jgi:hypothetical protein
MTDLATVTFDVEVVISVLAEAEILSHPFHERGKN